MATKASRILLVYPPSHTQSHTSCPAGIMMIGAVLEAAGHEVHLLDANAQCKRRNTEQIIQHVKGLKPDVVGMTLITPMVREAYRLTAGLKELGVKLLAGGPHATLLPEEAVEHGFDAAIAGEGEPSVVAAVNAILNGYPKDQVRGLIYRDIDGVIKRTLPQMPVENLDELPFPARHLVNRADFGSTSGGDLFGNIFSSRGCPARCAYCAGGLFGKAFRFRSAENVVEEIAHIHKQYGTSQFHFTDDTMAQDQKRVKRICQGILDAGLKISWSMMTRIDSVDEEVLALAARSGCNQIDYGVESGHPETLKKIHKPHTVDMVRRAVPLTARAGIKPYVFFILGFPWETPQSVDATLGLMVELSPYVDQFFPAIASILIPFPGTEIYEKYKDKYDLTNWWLGDERNYDAPAPETHSYFEANVFPMGAVLDADFFRYSPEMKKKIFSVFRYMYLHNLQKCSLPSRISRKLILDLSLNLYSISPRLERRVFGVLRGARKLISNRNGQKALALAVTGDASTA